MRQATAFEEQLRERIEWLCRLRWMATVSVAIAAAIASRLDLDFHYPAIYAIAGVLAAYNAVCHAYVRSARFRDLRTPHRVAVISVNAQISADLLLLALLLHFAGGVENPLAFFFVFHMIIASILLSPRSAYVQAALASALWWGVTILEHIGVLRHYAIWPLAGDRVPLESTEFALAAPAALTVTLFAAVYLTSTIAQRLREHEAEVAKLVTDLRGRTTELERATAMLSEARRRELQHLRKVAHELNAPLAATKSLIGSMRAVFGPGASKKQVTMMQRAEARLEGLIGLVRSLLTLAHSRDAEIQRELQEVDVGELVAAMAGLMRAQAETKGIAYDVSISDDLPPVVGDVESLEQMITNIISNALRYTPSQGRVLIGAEAADSSVRIAVSDTGIGIAPEEMQKIYSEFYRSPRARAFADSGSGLGLTIVRNIVQSHGGTIDIESQLDKGTTVSVTLPAARQRPGAA
jgi:signal transduction histidine kinase